MINDEHSTLKYIVCEIESGMTVKNILQKKMHLSSRIITKLKFSDRIFLNSLPVHVNVKVKSGDKITANIDVEEDSETGPENIPLNIIYEDKSLIILNKQPGIVVHPTRGHPDGTVANGIMHHFLSNGEKKKIRPVSRLDRDTSGIIIFAKNEYIQASLIKQMRDKAFKKNYVGIVHGLFKEQSGTINLPIKRMPDSIMLRHVDNNGDYAITHFRVVEYLKNATYVEFILETGRTHQIRVHCQAIGHPLVGETLYPKLTADNSQYDNDIPLINRQCLHSQKISFIHPITNKPMEFECELPQDIISVLERLKID